MALQELAWASFALLKNTNSCGLLIFNDSQALLGRGALGNASIVAGNQEQSLSNISKARGTEKVH